MPNNICPVILKHNVRLASHGRSLREISRITGVSTGAISKVPCLVGKTNSPTQGIRRLWFRSTTWKTLCLSPHHEGKQGPDSILRWHLTSIGNPIVEIRRSYDRIISTMGFPILIRCHLYIESGPRSPSACTVTVEPIGRTGSRIFVRKIQPRFVAAGNHWRDPARCLRLTPEHRHWHRMFSHLVKHKNCNRHYWSHLIFAEDPGRPLQLRAQNCFRTQNCLFNIYMMIIHRLLYGLHA